MRSFRSKPVGWRGESYRHYLAAKGVSTSMRDGRHQPNYLAAKCGSAGKRYFMPFVKETTIPAVDYPEQFRSFKLVKVSSVSPAQAEKMIRSTWSGAGKDEKFEDIVSRGRVNELIKAYHAGDAIPPPVIYYKPVDGGFVPSGYDNMEEVQAAKELGLDEMPIVEAYERKFVPGKRLFSGEFEYSPFELAEMEREEWEMSMAGGLTIEHPAEGINVIRPGTEAGERVRPAAREVVYLDTIPDKFKRKEGQKWFWDEA